MGRVEGKIALVTGAARGQGRSHALKLAEEGADIIALDICADLPTIPYPLATEDDLLETAAGIERLDRRVVSAKVDVRDAESLTRMVTNAVAELGGLDIVSVNAGICAYGPALDLTSEDWKEMLDVNLTGAFNTAKATIPHILTQGQGGSVIFTASIGGLEAIANIAHYNASKFGVVGLAKTLALELGGQGVRVNAVCPGNVDSPMMQNHATMKLFFPDLENPGRADAEAPDSVVRQGNTIPVPYVDVVDISNAVLYLASDEARYVTGTTLVVDAGRMLK
jgi:SDR family mycofactocin-dependent oxidoreductase